MRELFQYEVVARWLWGAEYAASSLSAIEWYNALSRSRKILVRDFMREYAAARPLRTVRTVRRRRARSE